MDVDDPDPSAAGDGDVFMTTNDDYTNLDIGDVGERSEKSYTQTTMSQSSSADTLSDMKSSSPSHKSQQLRKGVSEVGGGILLPVYSNQPLEVTLILYGYLK